MLTPSAMQLTRQFLRTQCCRKIYCGERKSIEEIKKILSRTEYKGGCVNLVKQSNGVAHLVLNHPERRNAMSGSMMVELLEAVEELETWTSGIGVVLRGADNKSKVFCSGGDLKTVEKLVGPEMGFAMACLMGEATARLAALPLLSVCLVGGPAVGGGAELTTCTDIRLATPTARVCFVQAVMGVAPGWGGAARLVELVGKKEALKLLLSSEAVDVEHGLKIGFFDAVMHNQEDVVSSTEAWLVEHLAGRDPSVTRVLKQMVVEPRGGDREARLFAPLWGGHANSAALSRNIKHK